MMFLFRCAIWMLCCVVFGSGLSGGVMAMNVAVFGLANPAGSASVETDLADGLYPQDGFAFRVTKGRLSLASPASQIGRFEVKSGTVTQKIDIRPDHLCVSSSRELQAALAASDKSGLTLCLNPGIYAELDWRVLRGVFQGLSPRHPLTVTSSDPAQPAVLTSWVMNSRDDRPNGNVILKNLSFQIETEEVPRDQRPFRDRIVAIQIGQGGVTENMRIENVHIAGSMGESFAGAQATRHHLNGIVGHGKNLTIHNSSFTRLMNAIAIWGDDILISHNQADRLWGDFLRLSSVKTGTNRTDCVPSHRLTVRNNLIADTWSNNRFHPDIIHMFPHSRIQCGLRDVLIEGNIAFIGGEGARQPGYPTGFETQHFLTPGTPLRVDTKRIQTFPSSSRLEIPPAVCPEKPLTIAIQRAPGDGQITLVPTRGVRMDLFGTRVPSYAIKGRWEVIRLRCPGKGANHWQIRPSKPGPQGFFANAIDGPDGYRNLTIRHNIFWLTSSNGIAIRDDDNRNIFVHNNSLLQPFPGDRNGDGIPNMTSDGFNLNVRGTRILITGDQVRVQNNVTASLGKQTQHPGWTSNDDGITHNDAGRSMLARFKSPTGRPEGFFPLTSGDAVRLARPRAPGPLAQRRNGALAPTPAQDWYDWSWVPENWPLNTR